MDVETARGLLHRRGIEISSDDSLLTFVLLNDVVLKGVLDPFFASDTNQMQTILRGKGIRISNDDPIFTLLALNGIVLHSSIDQVRRAQTKTRSKTTPTTYLKATMAAVLAPWLWSWHFFRHTSDREFASFYRRHWLRPGDRARSSWCGTR